MGQIAVFIDRMRQTIPNSFIEKLHPIIKEIPEIGFISVEEDLTSSDAIQRMSKRLEQGSVDRMIIIGGSPKNYESSFHRFGFTTPLNPYQFSVANIKQQSLWNLPEEESLKKTKEIILKSIRIVSLSKPIHTQTIPINPEVLIIGGGIAGISVALALAQSGIHVNLIEKEKVLGGGMNELRIFYQDLGDAQKWLEEKISDVTSNQNINLFTQTELIYLKGHIGRFEAKVRKFDETEIILHPSLIVVATGFKREIQREGIFAHRRVVTFSEIEKLISETKAPPLYWDGREIQTVTFIIDRVNEDIKIDSINAIKQALLLQNRFECQVIILCKDVKVSSDGMERLYRRARQEGVIFFKYEEPPKLSLVNGQFQIDIKDTSVIKKEDQWSVSILSDLIVLSESFKPNPSNEKISRLLGIHLGDNGFLMEDNPQLLRIRSNRRGIFILGGCRFPQTLSETLIEGNAVSEEVIRFLRNGTYTYELSVAEVDPQKCALCYTCPRVCPHSAITIEKYAERNIYITYGIPEQNQWPAAKVDPAACFGCGICVGECPAKAITLRHQPDELILTQMGINYKHNS